MLYKAPGRSWQQSRHAEAILWRFRVLWGLMGLGLLRGLHSYLHFFFFWGGGPLLKIFSRIYTKALFYSNC